MKNDVRRAAIAKRNSLSPEEIALYSEAIYKRIVANSVYKKSRDILCYASFGSEVDTQHLCRKILDDGKRLYLPRCIKETRQLLVCPVRKADDLTVGAYGILEPQTSPVKADVPDFVVVPGVAFDSSLGRMGYGAGYYDRFLAENTAVKCMPAFSIQKVECASFEKTDIAMDMVVTEGEIIV